MREIEGHYDTILFVSSSGHCSLDCHYCIVNPIVKHQPTLSLEDYDYLFEKFPGTIFMAFSGKGDFFAGYKKAERHLEYILSHDVGIGLDINAVMIHELAELGRDKLDKIKSINVTFHYEAIKQKNALKAWSKNIKILVDKLGESTSEFILGTIISPKVVTEWDEGLRFYKEEVFPDTGKKISLIKDVHRKYSEDELSRIARLYDEYHDMIEVIHEEDFSAQFKGHEYLNCPAGRNYFRVWNDGTVEGCPYVPELQNMGNVKAHDIKIRDTDFMCSKANFCDCDLIARLGNMKYPG